MHRREDYEKRLIELDTMEKSILLRRQVRDREKELGLRLNIRPPTTTKVLMAYIFANCTVIEIYSMVAMWRFSDLSSLYALITSVITEAMAFAVYCAKAYSETKQEELMKLEREKLEAPELGSIGGGSLDEDQKGEEE